MIPRRRGATAMASAAAIRAPGQRDRAGPVPASFDADGVVCKKSGTFKIITSFINSIINE